MPNWASGIVQIEGKKKDVKNFCKLFIWLDEEGKKNKTKYDGKEIRYFARSFCQESNWGDYTKEFDEQYKDNKDNEQIEYVELAVDFAWSVNSCIINGYPQDKGNEHCLTLSEACKINKVRVVIDSEEIGNGFTEHVECDNKGKLSYEEKEMESVKCKCGNSQYLLKNDFNDFDEVECLNCNKMIKVKE